MFIYCRIFTYISNAPVLFVVYFPSMKMDINTYATYPVLTFFPTDIKGAHA